MTLLPLAGGWESPAAFRKVKTQVKVEVRKYIKFLVNLDLNLNLLHSLRPCWRGFLSILRRIIILP
jgi:hypothetical protein